MPAFETTHGHGGGKGKQPSRTYKSWLNAKGRCFNPNVPKYARYGGRGITMCPEWRASFAAFLADMGECPPGLTLDRIDNNGNYRPGNCRWATRHEQQRNKRNNRFVELDGVRMAAAGAAERLGLRQDTLRNRLRAGWSDVEAVNPNFVRPARLVEYEGQRLTVAEVARRTGIPVETLHGRLRTGWSDAEITKPARRYQRRKHV
jgi:lambda repressor-like predicted transcriptional regulator